MQARQKHAGTAECGQQVAKHAASQPSERERARARERERASVCVNERQQQEQEQRGERDQTSGERRRCGRQQNKSASALARSKPNARAYSLP